MDGSNPHMAKGWMDLFHHGKTGANAIDTHQHAYRPQQAEPAPAVNSPATTTQLAPHTADEVEAREGVPAADEQAAGSLRRREAHRTARRARRSYAHRALINHYMKDAA
jgi:hypothetical protein